MSDAPTPTNNIDDSESHIQHQWWGFNLLRQFFNRWWGFNRSNPDKTKDTISLLGNLRGAVNGGEFTAVGGNQIRVEVNVNASESKGSQRHTILPIASDVTDDIDTECIQNVETTGSHVSPPNFHENSVTQREPSMFLQQQLNKAPYTMYFRCLATRERGSPLWIPEPNRQLPVEYQRNGLVIGDVGIITEQGCFDSLFNITLPPDHPLAINSDDLPQGFSPLEIKPSQILKFSQFKKGTSLSSGSVSVIADDSSSGLTFESSAAEGAILTLPDGSNSEDLRNKKKLREYLALHLEEIYRCALIEHGREIKNGDLRVVTGFDKTTSWGMAAFLNSTSQRKPSFHLEFKPRYQGCPGRAHSWSSSGTAEVKAGPDTREVSALRMGDPSQQDVEYENQTVFVRTENPTLNSAIWDALLNESGLADLEVDDKSNPPHDSVFQNNSSPGSGNSTGRGGGQSAAQGSRSCSSSNTLALHPSNGINNMLLEVNQSARMVITGDDIWISVLHEDDNILPSVETLYTRIMNSHVVHLEDGVIFLEKVDTEGSPVNAEPEIDAPQRQLESESNMTPYDETEAESATQMDEAVSAEAPSGDSELVLGILPDIEVERDVEKEKNNSYVKKLVELKPESPVIPAGQIKPNAEGMPKPLNQSQPSTEPHGQLSSSSGRHPSSTPDLAPSPHREYLRLLSYYQDDEESPTIAYSTGGASTSSSLSGYPSYSQYQQSPTTAYSTGGGRTSYPSGYPSYSQQHSPTTGYSANGARAHYPSGYSQRAPPTVYSAYGESPSRDIYPSVYPQPPPARNYPGYPRQSSTTGYSPFSPSVPVSSYSSYASTAPTISYGGYVNQGSFSSVPITSYSPHTSTTPTVSHGGYRASVPISSYSTAPPTVPTVSHSRHGASVPISSYSTATPTVPTVPHGGHGAQVPFSPPVPIDQSLSLRVTGGQGPLSAQYSSGYPQPSPTIGYPSSQPSQDSSDYSSNPRDDFPQGFQ